MSYTFTEMVERMLQHMDTNDIIDILRITPEDLLDRFEDRVTRYYDDIEEEL